MLRDSTTLLNVFVNMVRRRTRKLAKEYKMLSLMLTTANAFF